ncbi:hypothetical protein ACTFIW_003639 [Dictyostelium discoideum]
MEVSFLHKAYTDLNKINNNIRPDHVLLLVDYLKFYTTLKDRAEKFNVSDRNCQKKIWMVLDATKDLNPGASFNDKNDPMYHIRDLIKGGNNYISMAIDSSFFKIVTTDQSFYNPEYGDTGVKFEMGASLINGKTLWVAGPFKSPTSDINNYRKILGRIPLKEGERFIGDKATNNYILKLLIIHFKAINNYILKLLKITF